MANIGGILVKTLEATKAGKLGWELVGRDSFRTRVGKSYLAISNNDDAFRFDIYDDDGNLLESSAGTIIEDEVGGPRYAEIRLYDLVRRSALKVDDALENLDQQLNDLI